ncbi:AAA family ATPase [Phenylobacterium sp. NIBR 498073]|uniref:AAA family ATPase n=1 Tax=Phenylobacterium sp. NIBR 498073 TaxID=3015177 RepID=UPI0022B3503B|nr:AAA family ATPase [Phenylobacterium sp. NIBR 498073]WGU42088.1 AAA family ATPase [Phenylobacterium sp. NIBR 498073]
MSEAVTRLAAVVAADLAPPPESIDAARWAQPFVWRDPATLPPRRWLYKPHLIRGFVSLTVSPGGVGKSTLTLCEALALASGRSLLGVMPAERTRVWCWNGEDPTEEIERRIQAAMMHHQLRPADLEGWLFTGSGRDADLVVAEQDRFGVAVAAPVVDALIQFIGDNQIGAVVIDPFVSSHRVAENDNGAIDRVAKTWARIANATGCAVELVHHTRKTGGADVSVEDGRGASALLAAARHARTLRTMNEQEADSLGVERIDRPAYVRIDGGKANLSPPATAAVWFRLANVHLPNGDYVQAASHWTPPDPFEGVTTADLLRVQNAIKAGRGEAGEGWRANVQTGDAWVGHAIALALGLDVGRPREAARVRELLRTWLVSGALVKAERSINAKGKTAPFVEVGRWAEL